MRGRTSALVKAMQVAGARERLREIAAERAFLTRLVGCTGESLVGRMGGRGRLSGPRLRAVRDAYITAQRRGERVGAAVAVALGVGLTTATRYTYLARRAGLLPPSWRWTRRRTP